ncbi:hypothetical protein JJC00_32180 [Bradyrhizobium diazoefficiens]|uniref:hypothetical protein n=1 Tax=Bradyrhizobium diazoefficiens TaxID=1355477 RepID=UPI0019092E40|nr:hypothetical protein [Bradyrhizobium diazoefficiens]QQO33150.1 hypothetical protein JJC00_32180 [Bradyrhizobium diazoefficiens]
MPTQAAPDNKQKANITTALENTECLSIALDEAAPIICTKVLAALMDPMISGIGRSASFVDRVAADAIRYRPIGLRGRSQAHEINARRQTKFGRGRLPSPKGLGGARQCQTSETKP